MKISVIVMSRTRYFLNLAYIGTPFRGSQIQLSKRSPVREDATTVQGQIEMGLKLLNSLNEPAVFMASRTDAGVHALNATCHFDLERSDEVIYEPKSITHCLNRYFNKNDLPIRILRAKIVPNDFHCKKCAISRTYLYRILLGKYNEDVSTTLSHFVPIEEYNRCYFLGTQSFDINLMRQAAKMFEGIHDFRTFMGKTRDDDRLTRREIIGIDIIERKLIDIGISSDFSWPQCAMERLESESHIFLDVYFKGKGFLYKQVRRCGAAILAAGTGVISLRDIQFMLQVPSKHSWNSRVTTLPAHGLYLCNIEY